MEELDRFTIELLLLKIVKVCWDKIYVCVFIRMTFLIKNEYVICE